MNALEITRDAKFSEDRLYRHYLTRKWTQENKMIMFIGLNPSIADDKVDDRTIIKCIKYTKKWGYGGFYMLNLFDLVSTDPSHLWNSENPNSNENNKTIINFSQKVEKIICAWGNLGSFENRSCEVKQLLKDLTNVQYLKLNKTGEPAHPLYLPFNIEPTKWNIPLKNNFGDSDE